ncbi:MAG TPA: CRTAC1 family protein [Candidatus Polarisedimenticolia bacterium]|nr:CRTAC1 family protein [Candidatus Polarisedimenticolia bacterium]
MKMKRGGVLRSDRMQRAARPFALAAALAAFACDGKPKAEAVKPAAPDKPIAVTYTDVTKAAGIGFVHTNGARGRKYLPETMGSGLVVFDYDGDGRPDLFFVNSDQWPENHGKPAFQALYRNRADGTFEETTAKAGLRVEAYAIGAAAADYDNDGDEDLYLNALGPDHLFRNRGDGTFEDVTKAAGVGDPGFGSSATFIDYDRDGWLDLFVCNYVTWSPKTDIYCTLDGANKSYCTPESYKGATNRLFRNRGDGTFEDVSGKAKVLDPTGKSLGVVAFDFDDDGFTDLAIANDTQPNFLYRNRGDGTFEEIGRTAGIAFSEEGKARGAMGIDAADYDGSGRESLVIGNFSNEMLALYHNEGRGLFIDDAAAAGIGQPSLLTLAFGCFFFDYDLDGRLDIFVANGHVENEIQAVQPSVTYAEPPHLFRGGAEGRFEETTAKVGSDLAVPRVARGAATADFDGDGDLDIAVSTNGGPAALFRNDGGSANGFVRLKLVGGGGRSNRDAIGARVTLTANGRTQVRTVRSAASYASQSEMVLTFGLGSTPGAAAGGSGAGAAPGAVTAEVRWPDGTTSRYEGLAAGRTLTLTQGEKTPR